jgi:hypothetical protein
LLAVRSSGICGRSIKPKRASARQKFGATSSIDSRFCEETHGTYWISTRSTNRCSCNARLCLTCQTITGGISRSVRVINTAVPGTRGVPLDWISLINSGMGVRDFFHPSRVAATKVVTTNATCCWRSTVLVVAPHSMSMVPLASSGMRVTGTSEQSGRNC